MSSFFKDDRQRYQVEAWQQHRWLEHGFGTRHSNGWPSHELATLKQIHSDIIVRVDDEQGCLGQGDALITSRPEVLLTIRTADCIPILIVDPVQRAVAAVHAGWRGSAAAIAAKTVDRLRSEFSSNPRDLEAAIGPGIGVCCYEVGPDVGEKFAQWFPELEGAASPVHIDLIEANRRQLADAGVDRIHIAMQCTRCDSSEFHSFRRDRNHSGRMTTGIAIIKGAE